MSVISGLTFGEPNFEGVIELVDVFEVSGAGQRRQRSFEDTNGCRCSRSTLKCVDTLIPPPLRPSSPLSLFAYLICASWPDDVECLHLRDVFECLHLMVLAGCLECSARLREAFQTRNDEAARGCARLLEMLRGLDALTILPLAIHDDVVRDADEVVLCTLRCLGEGFLEVSRVIRVASLLKILDPDSPDILLLEVLDHEAEAVPRGHPLDLRLEGVGEVLLHERLVELRLDLPVLLLPNALLDGVRRA